MSIPMRTGLADQLYGASFKVKIKAIRLTLVRLHWKDFEKKDTWPKDSRNLKEVVRRDNLRVT